MLTESAVTAMVSSAEPANKKKRLDPRSPSFHSFFFAVNYNHTYSTPRLTAHLSAAMAYLYSACTLLLSARQYIIPALSHRSFGGLSIRPGFLFNLVVHRQSRAAARWRRPVGGSGRVGIADVREREMEGLSR